MKEKRGMIKDKRARNRERNFRDVGYCSNTKWPILAPGSFILAAWIVKIPNPPLLIAKFTKP